MPGAIRVFLFHVEGGGIHASPLVLLPQLSGYGILMEKTTVVKHPNFYYHLTTIGGCDLPHLAAFCRFRDRVTFCSQVFELGKSR